MANTRPTNWGDVCGELLMRIRIRHPLVHHITNFVVMNDTANATLALGATPVMAHAQAEVAEMVGMASALVLNPGTLTPEWVAAMVMAGRRANQLGVPVIYDPVGVGATKLRTATGRRFLKTLRLTVIRGNSGEIGALAGAGGGGVRGVDSIMGTPCSKRLLGAGAWRLPQLRHFVRLELNRSSRPLRRSRVTAWRPNAQRAVPRAPVHSGWRYSTRCIN